MKIDSPSWNRFRYDLYAPFYDWVVGRLPLFRRGRRRSLELARLGSGERVLIVAAGTGLDLPHLPPFLDIVATDISPRMLDRARARAATLGIEMRAEVMDSARLDFPDESFDCVVLHLALAVVPDPLATAREAVRVLRPGGRVAVFDKFLPSGRTASRPRRALGAVARLIATDVNRQLEPILEAAGLGLVHLESVGLGGNFVVARAEMK